MCSLPCNRARVYRRVAAALLCAGGLAYEPAGAQAVALEHSALRGLPMRTVVWSNIGIGAGTAAFRAWRHGRPPHRIAVAAAGGAIGGSVMAGGFAVGGRHFPAARLLGVQTVAVGASLARNAGRGEPLASLASPVTLPFAPFVVTVGREDSAAHVVRVRLSAASLSAMALRLSAGQGMRVDWAQTVASGGVVFRTTHPAFDAGVQCPAGVGCSRAGSQRWGVVAYRGDVGTPATVQATLAHEALHVAQRARDLVLFGVPASDALTRRAGTTGRRLSRIFVVDVVMPLRGVDMLASRLAGSSYMGWYEREARTFAPGSAASFLQAGPP